MIQEVLRGDHVVLLDVLHAQKKTGKKSRNRSPRTGLTDRTGYGLDGGQEERERKRRDEILRALEKTHDCRVSVAREQRGGL